MSLVCAALVSCGSSSNNNGAGGGSNPPPPEQPGVVSYSYKVVNTYPHDIESYTQGLYWHDGYLWEGTGLYGESKLRKVELTTGEAVKEISLDARYFGEGIALLGGKIYQLTWRERECLVYDAGTFERTGSFTYEGEGWGLTTDGEKLYMSNGSDKIKVLDPTDFSVLSTFEVKDGRQTVPMLNELEWINGEIWANRYLTDEVVIINPETGHLSGRVDLTGLLPKIEMRPYTDVLNGIAYDEAADRIFVTGKKWHKLFEIELMEL